MTVEYVSRLQNAADRILKTQDEVTQIPPISDAWADFDLPSGYAVGRLVHQRRLADGAIAIGRKIGFTNPEMWSIYGVVAPIWGYVYQAGLIDAEDGHARVDISHFAEPKIEPEIVFHFNATPTQTDPVAIASCIDWVAHGFEIVQSHFPAWQFKAADTVADNGLHGALVIGKRIPLNQIAADPMAALKAFTLDLYHDGRPQASGTGGAVLGHPLSAIAHLIEVLAKQADAVPLKAGELVTTGTVTAAQSITGGQTWSTRLQGVQLPGLSIETVDGAA